MTMNKHVVFNKFTSILRLVKAMQRTQSHAKSAKNDLKPMDFLNVTFILKRREYQGMIAKMMEWAIKGLAVWNKTSWRHEIGKM